MMQGPPVPIGPMGQGPSSGTQPVTPVGQVPTQPLPQSGVPDPEQPDPPDLSALYRGWYPRWWLLSALFCNAIFGGVTFLQPVICRGRFSGAVVCQFSTWVDWRQSMVVVFIWVCFLFGWLISHILGVRYIERTQGKRGTVARVFRSVSDFSNIYPLLYIYGVLAFVAIVVTWFSNRFQSVLFALASIAVFVVNCCYMHTRAPEDRPMNLFGYIILAIVGMIVLMLVGPFQSVIFWSMVAVIVVSLIAYFWSRPTRAQAQAAQAQAAQSPQSAIQQLRTQNAATTTVGHIVRSLGRALLRRNTGQASSAGSNQQVPGQGNINMPAP